MFYTPKHCNECGEKINRSGWEFTASRRFCETCETEFKLQDWLPRLVLACGILGIIYGIGSFIKKADQPLNVSTTPIVSVASNKNQNAPNSLPSTNAGIKNSAPTQAAVSDAAALSNRGAPSAALNQKPLQATTDDTRQNAAAETIYFCGAQTKKGTPCARHVKKIGMRCWQHLGQPAMLPPEKLVASRQN